MLLESKGVYPLFMPKASRKNKPNRKGICGQGTQSVRGSMDIFIYLTNI